MGVLVPFLILWTSTAAAGTPPAAAAFSPAAISALGAKPFPAPLRLQSLELKDPEGRTRSLAWDGRAALLHVWASWCESCVEEMPQLAAAAGALRSKGIRTLAVAADSTRNTREFLKRHPSPPLEVFVDQYGTLVRKLRIEALSSTYLIAPDGHVQAVIIGAREWKIPDLLKLF